MTERKPYTMVIGSGEKGSTWIANQNNFESIVGLDIRKPKGDHGELILGDVFRLPIKSNSIDLIHADFIVNGLIDREIAAPQIFDDPDVLATNYFPTLVRQWFEESMKRSHDSVRRNIREVSTLLKTVAMREMWRVLANNGSMEILDFEYNIRWLIHYAPQIVQEDPTFLELESLHVTSGDFHRSASLEKVVKGSTYVRKIKLTKSRPPVGTNLPFPEFVR